MSSAQFDYSDFDSRKKEEELHRRREELKALKVADLKDKVRDKLSTYKDDPSQPVRSAGAQIGLDVWMDVSVSPAKDEGNGQFQKTG